ncbi:MAG: hypothetical protein AAF821_06540 [Cyanobacteria bacterium P01_D01_bin.156]
MNDIITTCSIIVAIIMGPLLLLCLMAWFTVQAFVDIKTKALQIYLQRSTPCGRCAYYTGCKELACAVHPYLALTQAAKDCRDFTAAETIIPPATDCYKY